MRDSNQPLRPTPQHSFVIPRHGVDHVPFAQLSDKVDDRLGMTMYALMIGSLTAWSG